MVPGAGIEPARPFRKREILSLLCLPISPSGLVYAAVSLVAARVKWSGVQESNLYL